MRGRRVAECGVVLVAAFLAVAGVGRADERERYEARTFVAPDGAKLPYRLLKPATLDPAKTYPLVLFLHGAGERGDDNAKQLVHGCRDFAADALRGKHPCFVVAPQCPGGKQWVEVPWSGLAHEMPAKPSDPLRLAVALVESLKGELPVDADRVYVTGLSMGGFGTWDAVQRFPKLFAAAVPVCGGGDARPESVKPIAGLPVWIFHGDKDTVVKTSRSRDMVAALKQAGGAPRYTEYPGVGHNSWSQAYATPELYDWLFAQKKGK